MAYQKNYVFPEYIIIEIIRGACTAKCIMCLLSFEQCSYECMSLEKYDVLLQKLKNNKRQKFLTLNGLGEPLLDNELPQKIKLAKDYKFKSIGFSTNCTELEEGMAIRLLDAGLDTIICSIDGFTKETHENIRIGTDFNKIVANVENFLKLRNKYNYQTKVLVRFVNQELNRNEWDNYYLYWNDRIDKTYGDGVLRFDAHNWGGKVSSIGGGSSIGENKEYSDADLASQTCYDLENRLMIQADGELALCCGGFGECFKLGNVFEEDPYLLYNGEIFTKYREAMRNGNLYQLKPCATCSVITNRLTRVL